MTVEQKRQHLVGMLPHLSADQLSVAVMIVQEMIDSKARLGAATDSKDWLHLALRFSLDALIAAATAVVVQASAEKDRA